MDMHPATISSPWLIVAVRSHPKVTNTFLVTE
ncbi:hypothetical protein CCACVL1_11089 [Corchorus capsularis]|uniref:Uncharacterized protein n=1 Tax=Corchorus capsularis TaxID=210143 RepID=A0A1R3IMV9_COCAP|nr:hypothetical protein CCACVL1_11089 [Corchorus capsularis]